MMKNAWKKAALLLALVWALLLPLGALAEETAEQFALNVSWTDGEGNLQTAPAARVPYENFTDCYWVQVPAGTALDALTLHIVDTTGMYTAFSVPDGTVLSGVADAGTSLSAVAPVQIMALAADGQPGALLYLYVSTQAALPDDPAAPVVVQPVDVTVIYVNENNEPLQSFTQTFTEGRWPIEAPAALEGNYVLAGESTQYVEITAAGADKNPVVFQYRYEAPAVNPVTIPVRYLSQEDNLPVAQEGEAVCQPGTTTIVTPAPQGLLTGYVLTGDPTQAVTVDAEGHADKSEVVFYYQQTIQPQKITVYYCDESEKAIALPTEFVCQPGENDVAPAPADLPQGYELADEATKRVTLDENGLSADRVTFHYCRIAVAVNVPVKYVNQQGEAVAQEQTVLCQPGETVITAAPEGLLADYTLDSAASVTILVDENGAAPAEAVFTYRYTPDVPAPKIALVNVKYVSSQGSVFYNYTETCVENAENAIAVDWEKVPADYELASGAEKINVQVDANGVATPAEVIFQFRQELTAKVTVYYLTPEGQTVATAQEVDCYAGNNSIAAAPQDLLPGYALQGEGVQNVTLAQDGSLTPAAVIFYYVSTATPTPAPDPPAPGSPTPVPDPYTPMDAYAYPRGDSINFRSAPSTDSNTLRKVGQKDLAHIFGQVTNDKKETWYAVQIGDETGFLKDSVVRLLSDAEVAAIFGYTPAPTQAPTPSPSPVPDGVAIDRWAFTNAKVNFRKEPVAKAATLIRELAKNTQAWVYSAVTVENEQWYLVRVNGTDGYLMAKFVDLCSQSESDQIQGQLSSPVPTQTPPQTAAPTETPTPQPPTEAPTLTPTATPAAYRGYALTQWQVALRTGVTDDTILEWLAANSLVYVSSQTYVNQVWSAVQSVNSGNYGFVIHEALRPVSNEEARLYMPPQSATATPVPQQVLGYAMTVGDGVPMRTFPDTNAEILRLLPYGTVANVQGQTFAGTTWHLVQYEGMWGYIREDQMRMLSEEETIAYLQSQENRLITPTPAPTPEPISQNSLSSYGHVQSNSGKVNLRAEPSRKARQLRLLDNYAFALVLGSVQNEEGLWYHVSQAGTEGYISGDYFKVLSLGELTTFLQSSEYLKANSGSGASSDNNSSQIQPVEDYNQTVWKNPALSASYEPFNPYATPTPDPERLPTATPTATASPTPTPAIAPVDPAGGLATPAPDTKSGGSAWPWVLLALAAIGGGGAYYAYTLHRQNERRRQAVRAQQARQAYNAGQPQTRAAQNNPQQAARPVYPPRQTPNAPVSGAAVPNRPAQTTNPYRPVSQREAQRYGGPRQATQAYNPQQTAERQATQAYQPQQTSDRNATQAYQPQQTAERQATQAYQPQQTSDRNATQAYRPQQAAQSAPGGAYQRQRRADRHRDQEPGGEA